MNNQQPPFRHILLIEDQKARRIIALEEKTYTIGRESSNDIVVYERVVSRQHATLLQVKKNPNGEKYSYRIVDGDLQGNRSTNGLIINGRDCQSHDLQHGDIIFFGGQAKASYYILTRSLEIALFNPVEPNSFSDLFEHQILCEDNTSTIVYDDDDHEQFQQDDLTRLASFPELSPNPIIEINFQGKITYINPAAYLKFSNLQELQLSHPILSDLLEQSKNTQGNLLLREVQVEEQVFEQYVHYLPNNKLIRSYIFDITERKHSEQQLKYQAFHDLLTGLPNRAWFNQQLNLALSNAKRQQVPLAILFLDLDGFKNINDTLGHSFGDQVLQNFAKRLTGSIRAGDTVCRWGGDEFVILLPYVPHSEDTIKLAQRLLEILKQPFEIQKQQFYIKTSMGIALYPHDGEDAETLLKNADAALYRAKERGRNHYQFYSSTMTSKASLVLKLENLLHQALDNEELSLHYQPQVNLKTGEITGMEALLRWYHPELGQVSPAKLIPLAEQTDLIIPIGQWVLHTACEQSLAWQKSGLKPMPIAVNFSPRQFQQPNLVSMVTEVLQETGFPPDLLEVEITESTIMQNEDFARQALQELRQMGVHISLDDFGTGYSSLSYLQKFPFNTLKIDQCFIQSLSDRPQDLAIISAMITLGNHLQLRVIAEGVETLQQLELLQRLHCEEVQGFWFSRPLKAEDATKLLEQHCLLGGDFYDLEKD
ncbi:EAL domain-containing protein [Gloeothece verrucosa]|uniref:Diguanylate cyclase/phosphodiesterase with PAS/PAC sensor(S) n=1 Tax=Gloeothece verrucosa (strain PCC 7822) TaxID=497965 RepID=E0UI85_GLOV7|nr:EAL domain-containing protein [Gloeothece verrucosa]ADN15737.1 diguanylate cyclase/phosphodiesterase with PAS/PAC sensor(s) [Gloeothece verrucosa PCC 7822]